MVYLNDCGELHLLSIIREDLEELKLLAEQVSKLANNCKATCLQLSP
jgi:hypothetical protein